MAIINDKDLQRRVWRCVKKGTLSRLIERDTGLFEGMERAPNFQKGHCRASKRQKNSWVPLAKFVNKFFMIFWKMGCVRMLQAKSVRVRACSIMSSVYHSSESMSYLRIWNLVSDRLKELNSISSFKNEIK